MAKTLIIEIPYGGLGDHLFHSHIPRIAKETGAYDEVLISKKSLARHEDYIKITWECNPWIDGFTEKSGFSCDLNALVDNINHSKRNINLLDAVLYAFKLEDNKTWHEPEVYYKPKYILDYALKIYDPNFLSWVGIVEKEDIMLYLKKHKITLDAIMKIRNKKALYVPKIDTKFIETPSLFNFCDLIYSCEELYCLTSGTATLAAALNKKAIVFYGKNQPAAFRHSKLHHYNLINRSFWNKLKNRL